ncbi:MAG: outer membrane beta-barrel protein [Bacteroidales bacterium]|nr:outer membrane beta-barrel protein [Bacteroidales bacterium]MDD4030669.1 outer membrane beta-barrel protein [Bacteroidales bacterium]MDD4434641.1 outer membrane beta-barrel protein [Bacteroidales bacterium]MDD5732355.1 outer membrane beta-barrel protein [Bacteroidales bacterium]
MVRKFLIAALPAIIFSWMTALHVAAQERDTFFTSFCIAPQIGTDIGGTIPIPFSSIGGAFNAYPKLNATLGARFFLNLHPRWSFGANLNYKTIAMDADARVTNQKFKGENTVQYFTGTSEMSMSFQILELPVYVEFLAGSKRQHGIQVGIFGSRVMSSRFITYATKGFVGSEPDRMDSALSSPQVMDFSSLLDKWDVGLFAGYEARIFPRIRMGLHVMIGMKDIFLPGSDFFDYKMKQVRGSVTVSYDLIRIFQR